MFAGDRGYDDIKSMRMIHELKGYEKYIKENVSIEFYRILSGKNTLFGMNKNGVKIVGQSEIVDPSNYHYSKSEILFKLLSSKTQS